MTDEEEIQRLIRFQASQAAMAFLSEKIDEAAEPPKPPEITVDETSTEPVKLDMLGFGRQSSGVTQGAGSSIPPPSTDCFCLLYSTCAVTPTIYFTFEGISNSCGCVDLSFINPDTSRTITAIALEGTIQPSCDEGLGYPIWSGVNEDLTFDYDDFDDAGCGTPGGSDTPIPSVIAWCDGSSLKVFLTDNISVMFYAEVCSLNTPYESLLNCGDEFPDDTVPPGGGFGPSVGCATGGTVTVSFDPPLAPP